MTPRNPPPDGRPLVMPQGRSIPRSPVPRRTGGAPAGEPPEMAPAVTKAGGELTVLASQIRACVACTRACDARALGTGYPRAPIMLVKDRPSSADLDAGGAFTTEAEALTKAFDALGIPMSWVYGSTSVRCGSADATDDEIAACAGHLLAEIEAVGPRVVIAFGERALRSLKALDGRCGIRVPDELAQGARVAIRVDLDLVVTEPLPEGLTQKDAKRRLWRDIQVLGSIVTSR